MYKQLYGGIGLALAASAVAAQTDRAPSAPDPSAPKGETFIALDANGDGALSRSELARFPEFQRSFEKMDTSKDGTLSVLEYSSSTTGSTGIRREPGEPLPYGPGSSPQSTPGGRYR